MNLWNGIQYRKSERIDFCCNKFLINKSRDFTTFVYMTQQKQQFHKILSSINLNIYISACMLTYGYANYPVVREF